MSSLPIDISYGRIFRITSPVLVTQLSHTAMGVIDTMMVGQLGVTALGAVGLGNLITWWFLGFFWGLLTGTNTLVAQAVGAGDRRGVGVAFWQGMYLGLAATVLILGIWPLVPQIMAWAGGSPEVQAIATEYMQIRLLGGWGVVLLLFADNFYRGLGRTQVPMWCGLCQLVLNCGLNYVLIFGKMGIPALGTAGAAWGTIVAQSVIGLSLLGTVLVSGRLRREFHILSTWRLERKVFSYLVRISTPIGVQMFMEMGGITVFSALIARLGDAELAATNAVIQTWSVTYMGTLALSIGATTLVGQCIGAGSEERAREVTRRVMGLGYAMTAVAGVVYLAFPQELMGLFVDAAEAQRVLPFSRPLYTVVVLCLVFDLKFNVLSGALRGAGDTTYSMLVNVGSAWLVFVPATIVATASFGLLGAWSCLVLHVVIMAVFLELRMRGRAWVRGYELGTTP